MNQIILNPRNFSQVNRFHLAASIAVGNQQNNSSNFSQLINRRFLFTDEVLGIDKFVATRNRVKGQFSNHKEKFIERLSEHISQESNSILSEDLKNLVFLVEDNSTELDLLKKTIEKFEEQNQSLRFGTFQFGPVVMRLVHHLNKPEFALQLLEKKYVNFYNQLSSVTIAMNLLFINGRYKDVIKLFKFVTNNYKFDIKYPSDFITLYLAACYKINTPEAFEEAFKLLRSVKLSSNIIKLRSMGFFFALAIQHGHPNIALEILHQLNLKSYPHTMQSLRLLAFSEINRYHDVFDILKFYLKKDTPRTNFKVVHHDVIEKIRQNLKNSGNEEKVQEFEVLVKNLEESGFIEKEMTLEQSLLVPIEPRRNIPPREQQQRTPRYAASDSKTEVLSGQRAAAEV